MKNCSIFVVSTPKTFLTLLGVGIFISTTLGERYNLGLSIPNGFCTVRSEIVFGETGIAQPFFCALYYNFSSMPKTLKNCQAAQGASKATCAHETSIATVNLTVSNPYSIPTFDDFIAEAIRRFDVEKNAKNKAYAFILENGLYHKFVEFSRSYQGESSTLSSRIEQLISNNA